MNVVLLYILCTIPLYGTVFGQANGEIVVDNALEKTAFCLLSVNRDCADTCSMTHIKLSGINKPLLHNESHASDTVVMTVLEIEGNKYRNTSYVNSEGRPFFIKVIYLSDTALFKVIDPHNNIQLESIKSAWFVEPEIIKDIPSDIIWTHIPLTENKSNTYMYGRIMHIAERQLAKLGTIVYMQDGLYRCLPKITLDNMRNLKYCKTPEGIALFIRPFNMTSNEETNKINSILSDIKNKWAQY